MTRFWLPPMRWLMAIRKLSDKIRHIDAALDGKSEVAATIAPALRLADLRFLPATLPEVDLQNIDMKLTFLGKTISAPVMVAPMTGGLKQAGDINRRMAAAAEAVGIPFGVGSQRVALEVAERAIDFKVRDVAPTIPLFANLGAIQLVKGYGPDDALRAVEMIEADALYLHLNAMQEVVQEGGDTAWTGVLSAIEKVCTSFKQRGACPVFVREVGFGIPEDFARRLLEAGVDGFDCAGVGGTSWTLVEGRVAEGARARTLGQTFADWGLTTAESITQVRRATNDLPIVASGGIRTGLDVAKCVALGATIAGMASPVLRAAIEGDEAVVDFLETVLAEIRATLFGVGAPHLEAFRKDSRLMAFGSST
ncbi:MAG: type 2 isopentenyl-diphosphate Delta-isomerase [Myxococcota bacterium]